MPGSLRRHGRLELLLVLPGGSKSLAPAVWTELEGGIEVTDGGAGETAATGSLEDALAAAGFRSFRPGSAGAEAGCTAVTVQGRTAM